MNQTFHSLRCERLKERAFWAQGIARTLEDYGKSLDDLPADLRQQCVPANQSEAMVSQTDMNRLWQAAAHLSQDNCFALRMAQTYRSNILNVLGLAAVSSETVGDAVHRVLRYLPVLSTQVQACCAEDDQVFTVHFEPRGTPHPMHIEAVAAQCAKIWKRLEGSHAPLVLETRLNSNYPGSRSYCESLFTGKLRLGAKGVTARMSRSVLRKPLDSTDPFLLTRLDASLEDMLSDLPGENFVEQVKQRIGALVPQREASEEQVADSFNMSARHLRRKLAEAQTSYEKLLDEVRMELAMRLIHAGRLNLGHVALQLGFLNPSSFTRAFRRWTGMSPTAFKKTGHSMAYGAVEMPA